jgi:hypothetical protein
MMKKIVLSVSIMLLFLCFQTLDARSESGKEDKKEQARETIRNQLEMKNPFLQEEMRHQPRGEMEYQNQEGLDSLSKEKKTFLDKEKEEKRYKPKGREEDLDNPAVWGDLKNQGKKR